MHGAPLQDDGYIAKILVAGGTKDIEVGTTVAIMVEDKDDVRSPPALPPIPPPPPPPGARAVIRLIFPAQAHPLLCRLAPLLIN